MKIMAVASGGGHWVQLLRMRPALADHEVVYVTVPGGPRDGLERATVVHVNDASAWDKAKLALLAARMVVIVVRYRPDAIITTGAAPGYLAIRIGRRLGARTVWVDSIANSGEMSRAGRLARPFADLWLTQWEHLAEDDGPLYRGAVV
ncbi:MAG: UDP-N-acetylglucosamine--LPS N-acetylglucosamine transferase [Acidimicrobiales bacterium]